MPDNFGRMTSDEAPQSLKDFCFPKQEQTRSNDPPTPPTPTPTMDEDWAHEETEAEYKWERMREEGRHDSA